MKRWNGIARPTAGLVVSLVVVTLASAAGAAGQVALARTGQATSYRTGDDGDLEAGVAWPVPRFNENRDGTISDALTGLVWLEDANCADTIGHDPDTRGDGTMTWTHALSFVSGVNGGSHDITACGYTGPDSDWRLPNVIEIESRVHAGLVAQSAWLGGQGFSRVQSGHYGSATPSPSTDLHAIVLDTSNAVIATSLKETQLRWVWLVRG